MRTRYPPCEKNFPTTLVSSTVGVTSHITPLPAGEGKGEGPAGDGVVPSWGWTIARYLLPSTPTLFYKECQLFPLSKYYPYLCLRMLTEA